VEESVIDLKISADFKFREKRGIPTFFGWAYRVVNETLGS
jgi:hypothetical protein